MTKLYQILNFQYQHVISFETSDEAKRYLHTLKEAYAEKFYIVELNIVYSL